MNIFMNFIANITIGDIVFGIGVWGVQDAIASIWHYVGRETWGNHAFRLARLVMAVGLIIVGINI